MRRAVTRTHITRTHIMRSRRSKLIVVATVTAIALGVTGCAKAPAEEGSLGGQDAQPAKLITLPGSAVKEVVLTPQAAKQIGVTQTPVTALPAVAPSTTPNDPAATPAPSTGPTAAAVETVPVTAVIYDPEGRAWTYTIPGLRTYLRVPIVVDHVDGTVAYLSTGPGVGTEVVSQGAPELLGAEYGVGEE
jgi:hypothetical protein